MFSILNAWIKQKSLGRHTDITSASCIQCSCGRGNPLTSGHFFPIMAVLGWLHTHCSGEMCSWIQSGGSWQTHWRASRRFLELGITLWNSSYLELGINKALSVLQKKQNSLAFLEVGVTASQRLWVCEALCRGLWGLFCCLQGREELHVMREFINTALWASRLQAQAKTLFNLDGCLSPRKTKTRPVKLMIF